MLEFGYCEFSSLEIYHDLIVTAGSRRQYIIPIGFEIISVHIIGVVAACTTIFCTPVCILWKK